MSFDSGNVHFCIHASLTPQIVSNLTPFDSKYQIL
jgi:hypothetical protein